jgi:hypothetical protein
MKATMTTIVEVAIKTPHTKPGGRGNGNGGRNGGRRTILAMSDLK